MRTLIWLIGIFAIAVGVAMIAGLNDGYVLLVAPPWRLQLSLNLLVVIVVLGFALGYAIIRVISRTLQLPTRVAQWRERRRRERAGRALTDSVNALFEGRFSQSLKSASRAYETGEGAAMAALVAARAAHAMQDEPRYREWLGHAAEKGANGDVARLMTEAELAVDAGRFDEAAARLAALREGGHRHIAMLRLEARVASALGRWEELVGTVRQLRKHKALLDEQAAPMLRRGHVERMRELAGDGDALVAYWKSIPANELQDRGLIERVLPLLAKAGRGELARRQVERLLDERWDSDLARQYAHCAVDEGEGSVRACLQKAEGWLPQQPRDAGLLFSLGQLCASAQLWGKARSYLESSVKYGPTVEAYLALAHLLESLESGAEAQAYYRAAAEIVAGSSQKSTAALLPA
ncbi:heme biosynthesis HemY N-terminal domain-containing protein [Thauera linaloolentis]|uniref:HemY domain-containing protein n=1 Tax=Thauera linaloolentis (strain DSM 12138 / JCM 21573 / CCUG 41526 / CIP 105981 / IAM 15112 / NBRC 102519 / 47Lol) TaxID=1123367 RepID=N6Y7X1_THAL4|nr:heme biosynthesis HemY N-terminal domain-containing protein [Thauera linaloolentis]ENO90356.1 HemY domain-containing protein [Thauera linaloolentis 47Lol = DSM 12138]MCM8564070.1 heme biosynthesis protein HemY [Thauera linaloolentis]